MTNPEDVDEINEYLQARRKKQDLGELPKPDATPGFIKKFSTAIFGPPKVVKVPLNATQPTYASPQAQDAVRKQLAEIMNEKGRTSSNVRTPSKPTPAPSSYVAPPLSSARSLSSIPTPSAIASAPVARFPQSDVWKNAQARPSLPVSPPTKIVTSAPSTPVVAPTSNSTSPIKVSAYIPSASPRTPASSVSSARETPRYMPPWVAREQRTNPLAPRITPPMYAREKENTSETPSVPLSSARMPFSKPVSQPLSRETTLPSISREDAPAPVVEQPTRNSFQSGEVRIGENDSVSSSANKPVASTPVPAVHHESEMEMTEEEALEKLPFEDVEGLSADDLAYLERKEKEHRAAQTEQEADHVSPAELHAQLDRQATRAEASAQLPSQTPDISGNDEKKKILERLRNMMATEPPPHSES